MADLDKLNPAAAEFLGRNVVVFIGDVATSNSVGVYGLVRHINVGSTAG